MEIAEKAVKVVSFAAAGAVEGAKKAIKEESAQTNVEKKEENQQ